jgi:hypothetical protein
LTPTFVADRILTVECAELIGGDVLGREHVALAQGGDRRTTEGGE